MSEDVKAQNEARIIRNATVRIKALTRAEHYTEAEETARTLASILRTWALQKQLASPEVETANQK